MFTGIVECVGKILEIKEDRTNLEFFIDAPFLEEIKVDQSIAHNGVCLTVTSIEKNRYSVTAIQETLNKTNLGNLKVGNLINLERCMLMNGRIDGHIVQGHVDQTGICNLVVEQNGSWLFDFSYDASSKNMTVEKGSICVNGVSLTVVGSTNNSFSVAIIPYTYEHTCFKEIKMGDSVNLEFDILGKYIVKLLGNKLNL
jgi:riboflavin synthase